MVRIKFNQMPSPYQLTMRQTLEQLISSHSVASAIKQPFLLQRLNWASLALLCLWSLSPLAGQTFLRMSYLGPYGSVHNLTISYVDTTGQSAAFAGADAAGAFGPAVDSLFGSSILAPISAQESNMDSWGNPKIPILESLNDTDVRGWSIVPKNSSYSSLVGFLFLDFRTIRTPLLLSNQLICPSNRALK